VTRVTVPILEAVEAFDYFCCAISDEDWVVRKARYEALVADLPGNDAEDAVQDIYHSRWTPPEDDPLRVAALHARRGLPWRCYLPGEERNPEWPSTQFTT
jgi:hypothetical protein